MSYRIALVILPLIALSIGTTAAARAEPFCGQLRAIVDDASRGFAMVRGQELRTIPDDGGGDSAIRFSATRWLPGASACGIDDMRSDGDPIPPLYLCWFKPVGASAAMVTRLAGDVFGCIGGSAADRGPIARDGDGAAFDIQRKDFVLSIDTERDRSVVLAISGK